MSDANLGTARGRIEIDGSGAEREFKKIRDEGHDTFSSLEEASGSLMKMGGVIAGAGAAISGGIGLAVKTAGDFDAAMNQVGAVSGATGKEFQDLRGLAQDLGASTRFSASESAEGMSFLAMAGFEVDEIISALPGTLDLAAAGQLSLGRAADIASNVLTGYGKEASEIGTVNDILAATAANANTDVDQLGGAMSMVAPLASASGLAFSETAAAIGGLSDAGIQGSRAGTTLRQMIASLENPTDAASEALDRMGVETHDAQGNLLPLADIVEQMEDAGLSTADAMTIFGARAGPGMAALVSQGADSLRGLQDELDNSGGAAKEMADRQMEGLNGALTEMRSAIEGALIAVGEQLTPALTAVTEFVTGVVQGFTQLPEPVKKAIAWFGAISGALLLVVGSSLLFLGILGKVIGIMKAGLPAIKMLGTMIRGAAAAFRILTIAMLKNPFVLIIAAIILLAFIVYKYWDEIVEFLSAAWEWIRENAKDIWNSITEFFRETIEKVVTFFSELPGRVMEWLIDLWNRFIEWGANFLDSAQQWGADVIDSFIQWLSDLPENFGYWVGRALRVTYDLFTQMPGRIRDFLVQVLARIVSWGLDTVSSGRETASNFLSAIVQFFSQLPGRVATFAANVLTRIIAWSSQMISRGRTMASNFLTSVISFFRQLPSRVAAFLANMITRLISSASQARTRARQIGQNIINAIRSILTGLPGLVRQLITRAINAITGVAKRAFNAAKNVASNMWNGFKKGLGISSPSFIEEAMFAVSNTMDDETGKMERSVRDIQGLGKSLPSRLPEEVSMLLSAPSASQPSVATMSGVLGQPRPGGGDGESMVPINIENINLQGVYDEDDPVARKKIVRRLVDDIEEERTARS